jgi:predicted transcriptional regulator of viral defense system
MSTETQTAPDWDVLFETAAAQGGYFTTRQAADAGYSVQLLRKHMTAGRVSRAQRGVYRVVHFPAGEHEDLIRLWLWSDHAGVFSHETALALHELSDALPARIHMSLPADWASRRLAVPKGLAVSFADVAKADLAWVGHVPVTSPARTISDCINASVQPDLIRQAIQQAKARALVVNIQLKALKS